MYVQRNTKKRSRNHSCRGKAVNIQTKYLCVRFLCVRVGAQARGRVRACSLTYPERIILSSVVSLAPAYFSTLSHKRHDFQEENYCTKNAWFDFLYNFYFKHCSF
jgi:hypothetical protein